MSPARKPLWAALTALLCLTLLAGCGGPAAQRGLPHGEAMSADQMVQTDFNRTLSLAMRDNLESLIRLLEKLYRRNPAEWRKTGAPTLEAAVAIGRQRIMSGALPGDLAGLRDIQVLSVSLDPAYAGDRAGAFVLGLADTVIQAHGGRIRFYAADLLDAQHVHNAARNVEAAAWMLSTRRGLDGQPLLLSNEWGGPQPNLSFEREFGALIGRLDLIASLLDENLRRVGINYVQNLLLFKFLPVR